MTWGYMALVGSMRFGLALYEKSHRGWMLLGAAAVVSGVLWAMHARRVQVLRAWTITVSFGAVLSVPTTAWAFGGMSGVHRGVAVLSAAGVCAYAVELLRARRVIVGA